MPRKKKESAGSAVFGEHIFPASKLTPMAIRWKELTAKGRHKEALELLEQIIVLSTPMFERFSQHEGFHHYVDLRVLIAAAQEKMVRWLLAWNPKKGALFSWLTKCSKNAFRSEVVKLNQFRNRFHTVSLLPNVRDDGSTNNYSHVEKIFGCEDHAVDTHDMAEEVKAKIHSITSRWGSPQEIGALHYLITSLEAIQEHNKEDCVHDKQSVIKGCMYAWGLSEEFVKFFYQWAVIAMRDVLYDKISVPFTEQDLFRQRHSYTYLPDLLDMIGWENMKKLITIYGGVRFRLPSLTQLVKEKEQYEIFREIESSDKDPDSVARIAKKWKKTEKSAQEIFTDMVSLLDSRRSGEHDIFHDESIASAA